MTVRVLAALTLGLLVAGCSHPDAVFVVLPNADGSSGAVTIEDGQNSVTLDKPYAAGEVSGSKAKSIDFSAAQVQQTFGAAIGARPIPPNHFRLYFISDSDTLTPDSQKLYQGVFEDIKRRTVYEVEVIGHTDTLGDKTYNQQLSMRRARALRERLAKDGLASASIGVAGRGELDLAVKTADQVSEPRNRRVEITVR